MFDEDRKNEQHYNRNNIGCPANEIIKPIYFLPVGRAFCFKEFWYQFLNIEPKQIGNQW